MKKKKRRQPFARLKWERRQEQNPAMVTLQQETEVVGSAPEKDQNLQGRLIQGDNFAIMAALLPEFRDSIDLVYADPPFLTGNVYAARIGRGEDSRKPEAWHTTEGYQDAWSDGAAYLDMIYPRLCMIHELLAPTGTLYLHLDWHASAYARVLLDEIFGPDMLLNEIVWVYHGPSPIRTAFKRKHDTILVYTKSDEYTFNADAVRVPYASSTVKTFESSPKAGFGKQPDLERGKVPEDWWYFPVVARLHSERTGYPTQKPEALLERIIVASSDPGDLVADFFCGSGTTPVVASRLGRRWIACDLTPIAIQTTYRRLLLEQSTSSFSLWRTQESPTETDVSVECRVRSQGVEVSLELESLEFGKSQTEPFPDNVILWEVDWKYDGQVFHSRSQALRRWRDKNIDLVLTYSYDTPGRYSIRIRAVDLLGRVGVTSFQLEIPND
ncbi:MAG: hypothetical protein GTO14_02820 [Anaerolineales bacterium]|nr:hypothetical protein [Anaerolineales bacterium]